MCLHLQLVRGAAYCLDNADKLVQFGLIGKSKFFYFIQVFLFFPSYPKVSPAKTISTTHALFPITHAIMRRLNGALSLVY